MCRLAAIVSKEPISPLKAISALETMKEGHDGSGVGLLLKDLSGDFHELKHLPILSGICRDDRLETLETIMQQHGFHLVHEWNPIYNPRASIPQRGRYFARAYSPPQHFYELPPRKRDDLLLDVRLKLRAIGENDGSLIVYSFWPDVIIFKEVGDPEQVADAFGLDDPRLRAKIIFAQGRQNTNYDINLYACHPFFIQGYASMTNGENTAFVPIKQFLMSRGHPGYIGYHSDSEVFTHILHYTHKILHLPLTYYKDVITPLKPEERMRRPDAAALNLLAASLRPLCIDGPNCVIGMIPDGTVFMVQDTKKLRPGAVGGCKGLIALASETCGIDTVVPNRDKTTDVFPMKYEMVIVKPNAESIQVWDQRSGALHHVELRNLHAPKPIELAIT